MPPVQVTSDLDFESLKFVTRFCFCFCCWFCRLGFLFFFVFFGLVLLVVVEAALFLKTGSLPWLGMEEVEKVVEEKTKVLDACLKW